jgi:hypothetical protein
MNDFDSKNTIYGSVGTLRGGLHANAEPMPSPCLQNLAALSHEFERAKLVVQTLEAVIPKACLYCNGCGCPT